MTNYSTYVNWRRTFHQYPELSDEEYETTETLRKILKSYGIRILDVPLNRFSSRNRARRGNDSGKNRY